MKFLFLSCLLIISVVSLIGLLDNDIIPEPNSLNTFYHNDILVVKDYSTQELPSGEIIIMKYEDETEQNGTWVFYYAKTTGYTSDKESCGIYADGEDSARLKT